MRTDEPHLLKAQNWTFPVPIAYGPRRLLEIGIRCAASGVRNPLIVTDRGSRTLPFIGELQHHLTDAGLCCDVFSNISPNPRDDEIGAGQAAYRANGHDAIIAIGGGSAMDGGKAICLTANNDIDLWAFEFEQTSPTIDTDQPFPKLITIPTTAGTGAETESTAMVTHVEKGMKFCIWHPDLKPSLVLLDPALTVGLPANLTAWTGADALTHAIEAYCVPGFHPLCDGMALEGLHLIAQWLPKAVREPENMAARGGMLVGSCLAGIAFLKGLGMVHAISHMVGAEYNTQHGLTNELMLWTAPPPASRCANIAVFWRSAKEEPSMEQIITIGLDIAKNVFQVHGVDENGKIAVRRQLKRRRVLAFFAKLPSCLVGMEACATSHYWAREIEKLGHEVRMMPPRYVKPYVKRNKNDAADAEAICEAVTRPTMRFVPIKTPEQQSVLMLHRTRQLFVHQRTTLINAIRAHMAEYGIVAGVGRNGVEVLLELIAKGG
jgi:alcohol dehydrogenase class IV